MRWICLVLLLLAGCTEGTSEDLLEAERAERASTARKLELATGEVAGQKVTLQRLKGEVAALLDKQSTLEAQLEVLRLKEDSTGALAACQERAALCLEQQSAAAFTRASEPDPALAAAERAKVEGLLTAPSSQQAARPPSRDGGPQDSKVSIPRPYVTVGDSGVSVDGTVRNRNDQAIDGFVLVELIVDGRTVDSQSLRISIPANATEEWGAAFSGVNTLGGERISARAAWDREP